MEVCFYCDTTQGPFVRDHFLAQSLGGKDGPANRVDACYDCDRRKGSLHPADWLRICPPAGIVRVAAKMHQLGIPDAAPERLRGRPGRVKTSPPRGPSTSDVFGGWFGHPSQEESRFQLDGIEHLIAQPMPPPPWVAPPRFGSARSLREHASAYLALREPVTAS